MVTEEPKSVNERGEEKPTGIQTVNAMSLFGRI